MQDLMKSEILSFSHTDEGTLECRKQNVVSGLVRKASVKVSRLFPVTDPNHFWILTGVGNEENEIGIIDDPSDLDDDSLRWLKYDLEEREFVFQIKEVMEIAEEFELRRFTVRTQVGDRSFYMRMDHWPDEKKPQVLSFKDLSNDIYEAVLENLDSKSMKKLASFIDR